MSSSATEFSATLAGHLINNARRHGEDIGNDDGCALAPLVVGDMNTQLLDESLVLSSAQIRVQNLVVQRMEL